MTPLTGPSRAAAPEAGHIKVFTLANGSADEFTKLLTVLYDDVKLTADFRNEVDEDRESNNTSGLKITRSTP